MTPLTTNQTKRTHATGWPHALGPAFTFETGTIMHNLPDPDTQPDFYAGVAVKRLFAWIIDTVIIVAVCFLIGFLTLTLAFWVFPLLVLVVSFGYRVITLANRSATWGMRLMNIEFRRETGEVFDLSTATLHTLGYLISVAISPLQLVSIVMMLSSARGQGLTDMVLGSVALNRRSEF
jgi:uncharacterized RDD family membrane protein YckC